MQAKFGEVFLKAWVTRGSKTFSPFSMIQTYSQSGSTAVTVSLYNNSHPFGTDSVLY